MGRKLMFSKRRLTAFAVAFVGVIAMNANLAEAGSIRFLTPREVVLRHNGTPIRAGLRSMTQDEVVVVLKTGLEKSYAMSAVNSISAADKTFQYYPSQETFDEFLTRSTNMRGVTIIRDDDSAAAGKPGTGNEAKPLGSASSGYARMIGMQPAASPQVASSGGGFVQANGFAGASQRPQGLARLETPVIPELDSPTVAAMEQERKAVIEANTKAPFALPGGGAVPLATTPSKSGGSGFALPPAGEEVLICSNPKCQKEVPGAKYGQTCPHCGIVWTQQSNLDALVSESANPSAPVVDPKNPFAKVIPVARPAPAMPPAPAPAVPDAAAVAPEGFSLEAIPWWGKLLVFFGSIMVLMFILGRR
ncbi:MAG TPA: hypothetical protein VM452_13500 [Caulifigura sp.]|nr:hypothetical protein [Caulifigura sp.]